MWCLGYFVSLSHRQASLSILNTHPGTHPSLASTPGSEGGCRVLYSRRADVLPVPRRWAGGAVTRTVPASPTLVPFASSSGTRWSARAQSWPRTSWCPPSTPRTSTVCFKVTSCCSAVQVPTPGTRGSAPAGTSSRARWLSAKTVYSGHWPGPAHTLLGDSGSSPALAEPGADVIQGLSPEPELFGRRFRVGIAPTVVRASQRSFHPEDESRRQAGSLAFLPGTTLVSF